jgi:hypothetical protein
MHIRGLRGVENSAAAAPQPQGLIRIRTAAAVFLCLKSAAAPQPQYFYV